jgi:DNA-binding NarL/FixJ family response regulator
VCADALRATAERLFPRAAVVVMSAIERAELVLSAMPFDLLVTGLDLPDGDALDFLFTYVKSLRRAGRVLVVTQHDEQHVLETLHVWQIEGVFDPSSEGPRGFERALRAVAAGQTYWSERLLKCADVIFSRGKSLALVLTPAELALLGAIGDGCDNATAARRLDSTEGTVATMRRNLHYKLKLNHRGDVVQFAMGTASSASAAAPSFAPVSSTCAPLITRVARTRRASRRRRIHAPRRPSRLAINFHAPLFFGART